MKKSTTTYLVIATSAIALLSSCSLDPNYRAFQAQQKATAAANSATNAVANTTNQYGVPQASGQLGTYTPSVATGGEVPFQPIPSVPDISPSNYVPTIPTPSIPSIPTSGSNYTVIPGDSLWKISRQFGTTVEEIQAANGLTTTGINSGQTLTIPGR